MVNVVTLSCPYVILSICSSTVEIYGDGQYDQCNKDIRRRIPVVSHALHHHNRMQTCICAKIYNKMQQQCEINVIRILALLAR